LQPLSNLIAAGYRCFWLLRGLQALRLPRIKEATGALSGSLAKYGINCSGDGGLTFDSAA
jgi:hypothetical protein